MSSGDICKFCGILDLALREEQVAFQILEDSGPGTAWKEKNLLNFGGNWTVPRVRSLTAV